MRAEALLDSIKVPAALGVMRAEALSDSMEAPEGLGGTSPHRQASPTGLPCIEAGF